MTARSAWVPRECTLSAARQPVRAAEFDALLTSALRTWSRPEPTVLRLVLDRAAEPAARDLAARESGCCSFFTFTFTSVGGEIVLDVAVPAEQVPMLDTMAGWAAAALAVTE